MRYIMVAYVFAAIIISHSYERIIYANIKVGRALVLFLSIFMISNGIYNSLQIEVFKERNFSKIINQNSDKIEEAFLKHGIKRGYSLYWDSSTVNVLSNNRVELAPVSGDMTPHTVMAPYRYYSSDQTNEKTAFVKVIQPIEGNKSDHPEFVISNQSIFDLAVDKEVIYENGAPLIEIYYFDKNYFTFSPDNDPKRKIS
jgi:hypothetical protein